ncbi:pilus assembly protein [Roseateles cellulosilyticus]|uniref:Pilus assembly protein n=1 Tax=Pelomonas cellulosilytica TaxID=2906762 RepID=A0ABS8XIY2_9BURK|nr:PilC/PilY family type IV pilus protein [Pelomonas sp. P8]MCE4552829.1 pilus assembly protein [Pelomonas sp. P8]
MNVPFVSARSMVAAASLLSIAATTTAQVRLADQPVFAAVSVPGNLALALSVEFPTAISVAYSNRTYSAANTYIGYFDPQKCYAYRYTDGVGVDNYFYPAGTTTTRTCSGLWSGNFLNWATMQTIDPFRWALTGGYRVIDTASLTVLEKAWGANIGSTSNFPDSSVAGNTLLAGATPFSTAAGMATRIWSLGNKMRFMTATKGVPSPDYSKAATAFNPSANYVQGTLYEVFVRVKVCDTSTAAGGVEANCTAYPNGNYKPTGLMQQYADKIRYSAFGYLNDGSMSRDGAVLRARQKFVGPTMPVPGGLPVTNPKGEWDATTGVMLANPDLADATDTSSALGITISNSGVMNYLNKFGEISGTYKTYDPVGELYYAVQRYFRNVGNVPAWSSMGNASAATKTTYADNFPVITSWDDPIQYSCQRNFILGIGDVNTHADRNLPGTTGASEPAKPAEVTADTAVNAGTWTDRVGVLQGLGTSLSTAAYGSTNSGALMAGLAYWANISDVRPDMDGKQTIQTYWLDVMEYQAFKANNQFYLAAKYGGFKAPENYLDSTATAAMFASNATTKSWWWTTSDTVPNGDPRPDNFFTASQADLMVAGLTKSFSSIASQLSAYSTSFVTSVPQIATLGVSSYASKYDAKTWTGDVVASLATIDATTGKPTLDTRWSFADKLAAQAAGAGWDTGRNIVTYNTSTKAGIPLRSANVPSAQLALLNTDYVSGDDSANYLNYLRGDRTHERSSTASGSTHAYRDRAALVGDIVNAKVKPVGPPSAPYSAVSNPGYDTFKTTYANRTPMVYAGSNTGMVHAIDGNLTGNTAGREVFAYVPGALFNGPSSTPNVNGLASVGNPQFTHHFLVDAPPLAVDVDFGRTSGGSGTDWRSLLIGGLGKGGKAIYALDITNPASVSSETTAAQKVLWEFTDGDLGYTYGQPVVVRTRKYGWVVVVASGYNNSNGRGYFFFINPRTGALLEKVATDCSACSSSNQMGLAHLNAFIIDLSEGVADAIYGGDLMGNIWRLDVTGSSGYPAPVKIATLTGSDGNALPITTKPLPIVQPDTNRRYITVGTGRLLDSSDLNSTQAQRFFAILDGTNGAFSAAADLPTGLSFPFSTANMRQLTDLSKSITLDLRTEVGWYIDLGVSAGGPGWRVLSDPVSYYGVVSFAATAPSSGDPCSPNGNSRVYSVDLGSGVCAFKNGTSTCYVNPRDGIVTDLQIVKREPATPTCTPGSPGCPVCGTAGAAPCPECGVPGKPDCPCGDPGAVSLVNGTSGGSTSCTPVTPPGALGLQRLNWREIIIRN